jgi:hypothetical protein
LFESLNFIRFESRKGKGDAANTVRHTDCCAGTEKGSGLVVTERTILHKTKKDLKSAGVIENLTTEVAENKFAAKDERF